MTNNSTIVTAFSVTGLVLTSGLAFAAGQYGPGVSDTEIKIGNTMPYSGPASALGVFGKSEAAILRHDQRARRHQRPQDCLHQSRRWLQPTEDRRSCAPACRGRACAVAVRHSGSTTSTAIHDYLNDDKVPLLFVSETRRRQVERSKHYPWTMGWQPSYRIEARIYARYILENLPNAKIAVLYQNDDFGKDYLIGMREGLGNKADGMIVATKTYETTNPTRQFANRSAGGKRRRRSPDGGRPPIRGAGDP